MTNFEMFTVEEVAQKLRLNPETVRRQIRLGNLRAVACGGRWRITEEWIKEFLENSKLRGGHDGYRRIKRFGRFGKAKLTFSGT